VVFSSTVLVMAAESRKCGGCGGRYTVKEAGEGNWLAVTME